MENDPSPDIVDAIDRYSERLRAEPGDVSMDRLWRAVFALDQWRFLTRSLDTPHPVIAEFPQGAMLLAFTTAERAREGDLWAGLDPTANSYQISVPLPGAIDWAAGFADHHAVYGILFDHPSQGFYVPLTGLQPMRDRMAHNPPL
ncbi:hypothetical protein MHM582_3458 [Microbacterium sp. HM58-2]|nr:hypothetical protein MHM582_3458 [Microbacterium sp. HM58-2]